MPNDNTHLAADGTVRQDHYGDGEQPWDAIVRLGWAPQFAAANIIKYLRRTKEPKHSIESAKWYWARLCEIDPNDENNIAQILVSEVLTLEECKILELKVNYD